MKKATVLLVSIVLFCCPIAYAQSTNPSPPTVTDESIKRAGIKPIGDWSVDPVETQELNQMFATALAAANNIPVGPDSDAQRHEVDNQFRAELETFLTDHPSSAYAPSLHLLLARSAQLRCGYSLAMSHFRRAFDSLSGSADETAQSIEREAAGGLARLLALTGQIAEFDALESNLVAQQGLSSSAGGDWRWAHEMRGWVQKHPDESYKCGLYCLDQLGRVTQPGQFFPKDITETPSSTNGFTAADLMDFAGRAGLKAHAAMFTGTNNIPVPCVMHLRSDHFVIVRERRGSFYEVIDPVSVGPRWLTAPDIIVEATGCVLVSDAMPPAGSPSLVTLDSASAAVYRGRCHNPLPTDHNDPGSCQDGECCPPGVGGGAFASSFKASASSKSSNSSNGGYGSGPVGSISWASRPDNPAMRCKDCSSMPDPRWGMPGFFVSEPYLTLWVQDTPLYYSPGYGPQLDVSLSYHDRNVVSEVSQSYYWHGASFGNAGGAEGLWCCSLLSFAELSTDGYIVDLMLPGSGWAIFAFTNGSTVSSINYQHNVWLEKQGSGAGTSSSAVTNLVVHYPDGSQISYGIKDTSYTGFAGVFYMTARTDPTGASLLFAYNVNYYLQTVTAADGTVFTLNFNDSSHPEAITSITTSYGASASFTYNDQYGPILRTITDAAAITSQINYASITAVQVTGIVTPYGTTSLLEQGGAGANIGIFDRTVNITNPVGTVEFYGQINSYTGADWTNFASGQIPTNTPIGTLDADSGERQQRNTFYWNAQQFAPYVGTSLGSFTWPIFMQGRIRHWLAATDPTYTHWDSLSVEQAPSPDGTTIGQLTWYDYSGKPANVDYEVGTEILPSVIARVMPDGSTWYQYIQRLTNGLPTSVMEAWIDSGTVHTRSNIFVYSPSGDMLAWTNALGVLAASNVYNAYHQVVTNYDALAEVTTNGYDATTQQITSSQNPAGLVTLYSYNGSHRLQSVVDLPINRTNSYTWNSDGSIATSTDPRGLVENYFWDGLHRLTGTSDSRGATTNLYYILSGVPYANSSGGTVILDLTATKDRLGNWTSYVYDALRRKTAETNANGVVTAYGYCTCGAVNSVTNALNGVEQEVTTYNFDNQGRLTYTAYADAYNFTNWYDSLGRVIVTGDGAANRSFYYNNLGLLTVRSNAYGAELTQSYDILDRPVYVTDANGVMVTNTYDNLNRVLTRGYPDGGVEKFGYSPAGLIAYTNQIGMNNFFAYDAAGRKTFETNADGQVLKFTNNAAGDLLSLTDGKNQTTKWNYDQFGRVTNKVDQVGIVILKYYYDAENRLTNRYSAAMGTTYYTNDAIGNLTYIKYPSSPNVSFQYDSLNRLTNMVDAAGTTKYIYTAGNQLQNEIGPFANNTLTLRYTNRLRTVLRQQQPQVWWTNGYYYDAAARLTNITSQAGSFTYTVGAGSPGSRLVQKLLLPNTSYITNTFDNVARLTGTYLDNSANSILDSAIYGYNRANQRTAFTNAAGTYVQYAYDNIGQLTVANSSAGSESRGYAYDAAWNLQYLTNFVTYTLVCDNRNEMTTDPSSGNDTYDSNGNLTYRPGLGQWYGYDNENRLTGVTNGNYWSTGFAYDGLGRLRTRTEYTWNGSSWLVSTETEYLYDGTRVIQERDINNNPTVSYTRGPDLSGTMERAGGIGGLLARTSGYSLGTWSTNYFYHADGNGNITYLVDSSQAQAASYRYDPFGNTLSSSGSMATANVYRFSSKEVHVNSGMYIYLYRFYDPGMQRWINRDPSGEAGDLNLYRYSYNNSIGFVDSDGLDVTAAPPAPARPPGTRPLPPLPDPKPTPGPGPNPTRPILPPRPPISAPGLGILCLLFTPTTINGPEPRPGPPVSFDPTIPDHRDDMKECYKNCNEFDKYLFKHEHRTMSDPEFDECVAGCMKNKGYKDYPPKR